ncbi:MAG: hypothetical protein JO019_01645 [Candidatus Kaiserbacteria bacterium]|nr:hypothetical protein [Candidatus Kaiserbacteria bacterium]
MFTFPQFVGLFNIFVGIMLTLSMLILGGGIIMWIVRLGTWPSYREEAIRLLEWAVGILFTLVILLLVAQAVQQHTAGAVFVLGLIIIALIVYFGYQASQASKEEEEH